MDWGKTSTRPKQGLENSYEAQIWYVCSSWLVKQAHNSQGPSESRPGSSGPTKTFTNSITENFWTLKRKLGLKTQIWLSLADTKHHLRPNLDGSLVNMGTTQLWAQTCALRWNLTVRELLCFTILTSFQCIAVSLGSNTSISLGWFIPCTAKEPPESPKCV